jgi:hypothetical protein
LATALVIYHRAAGGEWRSAYGGHLRSLERYSKHDVYYLNTARPATPRYLAELNPDVVIFHYTFLALRLVPEAFRQHCHRVDFIRKLGCPKVLIPHDEQAQSLLLCWLAREFGVSHIFSPAPASEWSRIYCGVDLDVVAVVPVLAAYVDEMAVRATARRALRRTTRPIDIGYRCGSTWPFYGRHGKMKSDIGPVVSAGAERHDLVTDISNKRQDLIFGDRWFDFLLNCKYVIGVEAGSSVFDYDGRVSACTFEYLSEHENPSFEQVETACFPGLDGQFAYRLISPRHIEAAMTKTCQVLVEGDYGGVLAPGVHYIELKRDFSNLDEALTLVRTDTLRAGIVDRAYADIILSGRYSYRVLAETVFRESMASSCVSENEERNRSRPFHVRWNRVDDLLWPPAYLAQRRASAVLERTLSRARLRVRLAREWLRWMPGRIRSLFRPVVSAMIGESRLTALLGRIRRIRDRSGG